MRSSGRKIVPSPKCGPEPALAKAGGRTFDRGHQAGVRLRQGALSRAQEERSPPGRDLRIGQSVHGTSSSAALPGGVECPHCASTLHRQSNTPKDGAQSPTLSLADEISIPFLLRARTASSDRRQYALRAQRREKGLRLGEFGELLGRREALDCRRQHGVGIGIASGRAVKLR